MIAWWEAALCKRRTCPEDAERYAALFRALYLTYHRRDGPRSDLPGASRAVLVHLAVTGPLTVGEAAPHLGRAQSVVSEIVDGLARKGLLERERDPTTGGARSSGSPAKARTCCAATARCWPSTRWLGRSAGCPPRSAPDCSPAPPAFAAAAPTTGEDGL